jgi:hypothetical protein
MLQVGFEPTIPVFERAKTVRASNHAATLIGSVVNYLAILYRNGILGMFPSSCVLENRKHDVSERDPVSEK